MLSDRQSKHLTCQRRSTLIGALVLCLPNANPIYWGNLVVYIMSYMRMKGIVGLDVEQPWLLSTFLLSWNISLLISDFVVKVIGKRLTVLLAICLTDIGLFMSYFSVQYSPQLLTFTHGFLGGLGNGFSQSLSHIFVIQSSADKHVGAFLAGVSTSMSIGGALINVLVSLYLNPQGKIADWHTGPLTSFTQTDVVDRVPSFYIVLALISSGIHAIAFMLLRDVSSQDVNDNNIDDNTNTESSTLDGSGVTSACSNESVNTEIILHENLEPKSYKPSELLRLKLFYYVWLIMLTADVGYIGQLNYYKMFGQLYNLDDFMLTHLGTTISLVSCITRILSGHLVEKGQVRLIMLAFSALQCVLFSFYYFTPMVTSWLFYSCSILLGCLDGGYFTSFSIITLRLFGPRHFSTNFGLVMTADNLIDLVTPPLFQLVLQHLGWFYLLFTVALVYAFAIVIILAFIPNI